MTNTNNQKEFQFTIIVKDEKGSLGEELTALFSKNQQNSNDRVFKRIIPIKKDQNKIVISLRNNKQYNLKLETDLKEYYQCNGVIIAVDMNQTQSLEDVKIQVNQIKKQTTNETSFLIIGYSVNENNLKFNYQDLQKYCESSQIKYIKINSDNQLDISNIFLEVFSNSKVFQQIQNGDSAPDASTKNKKKFDAKRLIRRLVVTVLIYGLIFLFFPQYFNKTRDSKQD